ncbi:MAG: MCE family protein [Planctomycetes bacterium]|nr:MCE family protein [Planctomycetota bacterium]
MRETTQNFLVGLTSIIAIIGMAVLLMQFGELDRFKKRYVLTIHTNHAAGLRQGSSVEYNGVPIGFVKKVDLSPDPRYPVQIEVLIDNDQRIPANAIPYSQTSIFGGSAILELEGTESGLQDEGDYFPKENDTNDIFSPIRFRLIEQITTELDDRMKPIISSLEAFQKLSETYTEFGENLNKILFTSEEGETIRNLNNVLTQISEALQLAKQWLGDEQMLNDFRRSVENAHLLIEKATSTFDRYTRLADVLEEDAETIVKGLLPISDQIASTLEDVRNITRLAMEGDGTVSQLLNNPDLYRSLDDAAVRLEQTLVEIQLYIQKIKTEGLDIDF